MYRFPDPLDEDSLKALVADPRYGDPFHPEHPYYRKFVDKAFSLVYPDPPRNGAGDLIIDPRDPLQPQVITGGDEFRPWETEDNTGGDAELPSPASDWPETQLLDRSHPSTTTDGNGCALGRTGDNDDLRLREDQRDPPTISLHTSKSPAKQLAQTPLAQREPDYRDSWRNSRATKTSGARSSPDPGALAAPRPPVAFGPDLDPAIQDTRRNEEEARDRLALTRVQPPAPPETPPDIEPSVILEFDGKELRWIENGVVVERWPAVSGKPGFEGAENQGLKNKGPLPAGEWVVRQDQYQEIGDRDLPTILWNEAGLGKFPGGESSWGRERVWLWPMPGTDVRGRSNFSIHGGDDPGSAGCVDLTQFMPQFARKFRQLGHDVVLRVQYDDSAN